MIRFASKGLAVPNRLQRFVLKSSFRLRRALEPRVILADGDYRSVYKCETLLDAARPMSLWTKEEGTMRWISAEVRAGDIFMDVGANIGIYTLAAAHRLGPGGSVYAFEPHKPSALALMRNLALSELSDRVTVFSCALSDQPRILRFNYFSLASGSSGSQLGHRRIAGEERDFAAVASEMLFATTVDRLIADELISPPSLVKIDVDGNELQILQGMRSLLIGSRRPRSVQVELNVGEQTAIIEFLNGCGYRLVERHLTATGKSLSARGIALERIAHNAIFRPADGA